MAPTNVIEIDDDDPDPEVKVVKVRIPRKRVPELTRRRAARRAQRQEIDLTIDSDEDPISVPQLDLRVIEPSSSLSNGREDSLNSLSNDLRKVQEGAGGQMPPMADVERMKRVASQDLRPSRPPKRLNSGASPHSAPLRFGSQRTQSSKRKRPEPRWNGAPLCIVIDDSDDDMTVQHTSKRARQGVADDGLVGPQGSDSPIYGSPRVLPAHGPDEEEEDEWENYHDGFHLIHGTSWKPAAVSLISRPDSLDDLADEFQNLSAVEEPAQPGFADYHGRAQVPPLDIPEPTGDRPYPCAGAMHPKYAYPPRHGPPLFAGLQQLRNHGRRLQALSRGVGLLSGLDYLKETTAICDTPGSVNKILQANRIVLSCSAVPGGGIDHLDDPVNPPSSNIDGALTLWRDGELHKLHAHRKVLKTPNTYRWYTINDIQWDLSEPTPSVFASSGNDGFVRIWDIDAIWGTANDHGNEHVHYRGDEAVPGQGRSCQCIHRTDYIHPFAAQYDFDGAIPMDIAFRPGHRDLAVACNDGTLTVVHHPLNQGADTLQLAFAQRGHSTGAITWGRGPTSSIIFASSESPSGNATDVHIHFGCDIAKPSHKPRFSATECGDAMVIDPSGKTLALFTAKGDEYHRLRVYDVQHREFRKPAQVVDLEPFNGMLPDAEGCVRLWDMQKSDDSKSNGQIIAQSNYNIGTFSIGDPAEGVPNVILGDCGGHVRMFKRGRASE
ncbi:hypothetical protein GLOTRDRAFT_135449 [Gloeophyllum trabeum ATCC 11539]|uniref:WD40 repeat-like protein n=1 Tax=Gloeophyllum trabeum (strain ATCC 11539 / FP-39264 / Madison 617) TaxID=670483 RepID=S7QMP2_GLOTA|nr:uncharacterized protein GLOTRDRAFT_135449 [Gloeophyllum trabeum ATCC 11539]EPQ60841.1 hypothetical protein GLOTRDRAFT_135449 [Gloeophyllum trabeum ATCC 11539]